MDALDTLRTAHAARDSRRVEVPEILDAEGKPLVVWARAITPRLRRQLVKKAGGDPQKGLEPDPMSFCIEGVIALTRTESGEAMFPDTATTRKALENEVSPDDVAAIFAAVFGVDADSASESLGN